MSIKCYSELILLPSFEERFNYLQVTGAKVGGDTFGYDRYLNQKFYSSPEWRHFRNTIIVRDNGCEMGLSEYPIFGEIYIHHIRPLTVDDLVNRSGFLMDPENVICVSFDLHNRIHYGSLSEAFTQPIERSKNDTCPWRK